MRRSVFFGLAGGNFAENDAWPTGLSDAMTHSVWGFPVPCQSSVDHKQLFSVKSAYVKRHLNSSRKRQPCVHIQFKGTVRIDVRIHQG